MLAEDNLVNQEVALAMLSKLGYSTALASNGVEAVAALKRSAFDLVLMDCEMPELDGFEATLLIRDPATGVLNPKIPIIAVTAGAMPGDREKCIDGGMDDYLSKPIEPDQLAQVIAKWLGRRVPAHFDQPAVPLPACEPAFDEARLVKRMMGNKKLAENVARTFLGDIPAQLGNLRKYLEAGDSAGARRQAHTLKGAAATASANGLRAAALKAEEEARAGKLDNVAEVLHLLEEQANLFRAALVEAGWADQSIQTTPK